MSALVTAAIHGLIKASILEFTEWQKRKAQATDWKPSPKDVEDFIAEIQADTPEALKAKVAASLGLPWPPG